MLRPGEIAVVEKPDYDDVGADEVIIKMKASGICGSDLHIYNGESAFAVYPNIIGHELAGEIVDVGEQVTEFARGDRVVINNVLSCGVCYACSIGRPNVCREVKVMGVHVEGGWKEFMKVSQQHVFKIPESIPWEQAALVEPYSIAAEVLDRGRFTEEDRVLICGVGPLGLILLQAIKRIPHVPVAVLDRVDSRLQKAKELGADVVIHALQEDVKDAVMSFTDQEGASLIIESTGSIQVFEQCVKEYASQAGRIVVLGFPKEFARISPYDIMRRELDIVGSRLNNNKFPEVIGWFANGEVRPGEIISHRYHFLEAKEALDRIREKPNEVIKAVLLFDEV